MYIEELIQFHWQNTTSLSAVIPAERVFTGPSPIPARPCVIVLHEKSEVLFRTNRSAPWRQGMVRIELHHESFDEGIRIAKVIEQEFDRLRLESAGRTDSVRFRFVGTESTRTESDSWKFVGEFRYSG